MRHLHSLRKAKAWRGANKTLAWFSAWQYPPIARALGQVAARRCRCALAPLAQCELSSCFWVVG